MKVIVIRHGQTMANIINDEGKALYTGTLNNELTDLTEIGKKQARMLSEDSNIRSIEEIYSSNLNRAIQTAELAKPGYEIHIIEALRERSLGIFEGKGKDELINSVEYKKYIVDNDYNKFRTDFFQKAPEGENYSDVSRRCNEFLNSLDFNKDITIGIFSHYHAIRCLFLNMFNINPKERIFNLKIEHCIPYVVEGTDIRNLKLISHNLEEMFEK